MSKLFACIISPRIDDHKGVLVDIASNFAHSIELLSDGVLFDVSGLERLIGKPEKVVQKILAEIRRHKIPGSVAVAATVDSATLLARQESEVDQAVHLASMFEQLPLRDLGLEQDTLNVFEDLGLRRVEDLLAIPRNELISRYGRDFQNVIDTIEQKGTSLLTPNIKEDHVSWNFDLDQSVENFEQLIFVLNHGLERLLAEVDHHGFSCEHLDLGLGLKNKAKKLHEIRTSFPTLDRAFWLKLINLRVALDPPEADIISVNVTAHFTKARPDQRGLYAVTRPEPESLLLTVGKLKKLVGPENVGVPILLDQRVAEPFALEADALPRGEEKQVSITRRRPVIAFSHFRPPIRAEVEIRDRRLVYLRTRDFAGHILNSSGVWKMNSKWWDQPWRAVEWDVEVEGYGIYRLCKSNNEWFLTGEYD